MMFVMLSPPALTPMMVAASRLFGEVPVGDAGADFYKSLLQILGRGEWLSALVVVFC